MGLSVPAQYYLTGEVLDIHGDKLQNVYITSHLTGCIYQSGLVGEFRILSKMIDDTLTFAVDGYEPYTTAIRATGFLQVTLKALSYSAVADRRLTCLIKGGQTDSVRFLAAGLGGGAGPSTEIGNAAAGGGEGLFSSRVENPFVPQGATVSFAGSTPRVSYGTVRRFLEMGSTVPPDAVKIEELLNYFDYSYEPPGGRDMFHCSSELLSCPWNAAHRLLLLHVCARKINISNKPAGNLVLLVDVSGSMDMPNKLPLIKSGIRLLVDNLRGNDKVSLVVFGRQVGVVFAGMPGSDKDQILRAVEDLNADGPSPGLQGLKLAYEVAKQQFIAGGNNRIVLLTDGDPSMDPPFVWQDVVDLVGQGSQGGIRLTCGGLGMRSVKDSRLPLLAEIGQGNFAYLDNEDIVEQLLAGELDQQIACVANDVTVTADFSPALVSEYRLIGYDNKRSALEDSNSIVPVSRTGSGNSLLALFELVPKVDTTGADTVAHVKISYTLPGKSSRLTASYECRNDLVPLNRADPNVRRVVCIALFGMKLQQSDYAAQVGWTEIEKMARKVFIGSDYLDGDYISMIDRAKKIYEKRRE